MFECHITCNLADAVAAAAVAEELHWSTSEIERDPVLGKASYFYLTSHDTDLTRMQTRMAAARVNLIAAGVPVVREKIEVIIYDTKRKLP